MARPDSARHLQLAAPPHIAASARTASEATPVRLRAARVAQPLRFVA